MDVGLLDRFNAAIANGQSHSTHLAVWNANFASS